ncbi:hypothetical protein AVEN_231164-1 [Araneus ventricosus]|uniref:Uncharacterized protein n=1 Tax=Araneus ventricosus TaxID=182803 RepID=A0A4Y2UUD7_ARAVE|nr:hypothetical protein AVEN_231164-1 [Araneus ventricosus]
MLRSSCVLLMLNNQIDPIKSMMLNNQIDQIKSKPIIETMSNNQIDPNQINDIQSFFKEFLLKKSCSLEMSHSAAQMFRSVGCHKRASAITAPKCCVINSMLINPALLQRSKDVKSSEVGRNALSPGAIHSSALSALISPRVTGSAGGAL